VNDSSKLQLPSDGDASGRDLGAAELAMLQEAIASGHLTSTRGTQVPRLEKNFAARLGVQHAYACASGSAAVHTAVAAVNPSPGDEVITTPITDMGAITAIIYQGAIPVFCDVDPETYNVTAAAIARKITPHTKAIIVTHLFGNPCDMDPIMALAHEHGIPVIEDCAQAFLCAYKGRLVGTIGDIGCFSFQQGKHMTTGEGGIVVTNNPGYGRRMFLFINKAWGYGDKDADHYFLAPNYRLSELQGAVANAQLAKLDGCVERRRAAAARMDAKLADLQGAQRPKITPGGTHVYWKYCLRIRPDELGADCVALGGYLKERGVFCAPRYIVKPAFECQVIRDRVTFGDSHWPWEGEHMRGRQPVTTDKADYPGTYDALAHVLVLPWNEFYTDQHVDALAAVIHAGVAHFRGRETHAR
jgi:dTDP-4-amino-4,6-dideoxygalactose transaminase